MDRDPLQSATGRASDDAAPDAGLGCAAQAREVEITTPTTVSPSRPAAGMAGGGCADNRFGGWT